MSMVRTACAFGAIVFLMPTPPMQTGVVNTLAQPHSTVMDAANTAFVDMKSFCERRPDVCLTAGYVAGRLEAKAKYSLQLIYEWAEEASGPLISGLPSDQAKADSLTTGPIAAAVAPLRGSLFPDEG